MLIMQFLQLLMPNCYYSFYRLGQLCGDKAPTAFNLQLRRVRLSTEPLGQSSILNMKIFVRISPKHHTEILHHFETGLVCDLHYGDTKFPLYRLNMTSSILACLFKITMCAVVCFRTVTYNVRCPKRVTFENVTAWYFRKDVTRSKFP